MQIITIANQKGGVGKSTVTVNLANALYRKGFKVAIQDIDNQGTVISCACDKNIPLYTKEDQIQPGFDFLVIDTPPYKSDIYVSIFVSSDLIIIPTKPSVPDWDAMKKFLPVFEKAKFKKQDLIGVFLFNDFKPDTNLYKQMSEEFKNFGLPVLGSQIYNRVAYSPSILADEGIYSDTDRKAKREIDDLSNEILKLLGHGKKINRLRKGTK